jgi:hypothetical protein
MSHEHYTRRTAEAFLAYGLTVLAVTALGVVGLLIGAAL